MWETVDDPPAIFRAERPRSMLRSASRSACLWAPSSSRGYGDPDLTADGTILVFSADSPPNLYDLYLTRRERL